MPRSIKGQIVIVPFPFDDVSSAKLRPALCLTRPVGPYRHVVLAFITSKTPSQLLPSQLLPSDVSIETRHPDFAATGLLVTSTLRLHQLVSLRVELIERELGDLPADLMAQVPDKLRHVLDLQVP